MIKLKNISFCYIDIIKRKRKCVFSNLTLTINKGASVIYGENGVGKTTLAKILCGFLIPQNGEIFINDEKINYKNFPYDKFSIFTNYTRTFYWQLSVYDNLSFFGFDDVERIKTLAYQINLKEELLSYKFSDLSSGNKAKAVMLKTFLENREVIVLDDLSANIDSISITKIKDLIKNLKTNRYVIITTSNPAEFTDIADYEFELSQ